MGELRHEVNEDHPKNSEAGHESARGGQFTGHWFLCTPEILGFPVGFL